MIWGVCGSLAHSSPNLAEIESEARNIDLDPSRLLATRILLNKDAANSGLKAPSSAKSTYIQINAAASNINVLIPDDVAATIEADTSLCAFAVGESRFPKAGSYYVSADFEGAENRVELKINHDVSRVQVNQAQQRVCLEVCKSSVDLLFPVPCKDEATKPLPCGCGQITPHKYSGGHFQKRPPLIVSAILFVSSSASFRCLSPNEASYALDWPTITTWSRTRGFGPPCLSAGPYSSVCNTPYSL